MADGLIRMDYEATLAASQALSGVNDLIRDTQSKHRGVEGDLASWEGAAASRARSVMAKIDDVLASYDGAYKQFARFFVNAAEQLSGADEGIAQAMDATWNGAPGTGVR